MPCVSATVSPEYGRSLAIGGVCAIPLFYLAVLNGGLVMQVTLTAMLGCLGGAAVMVARRPQTPTVGDVWIFRLGFYPLWLAAQVGVRAAWTWTGRL